MSEQKTHWKKYHNPDYLGAYAFQPEEVKILTIKSAGQEKVMGSNGKKEDCLVVHFTDRNEKPLICNVTNSKAIAKVAGSNYVEDWKGHAIELFVTTVQAFGETVEAVRVKPTKPIIAKPELTKQHPAYEKVKEAVKSGYTREKIELKYTVSNQVWEDLKNGIA